MYRLHANGVFLDVLERDQVTSGSAKVFKCQFTFDGPYWDDLSRTAVFRAYNPRSQAAVEVIREVALDRDGLCEIPWEVTKIKNRLLAVGVYGTKTDGTILPTIWVDLDEILPGATAGEATKPPTPDKYQQFVQQVEADADRAEAAADQAAASASAAQGSLGAVQDAASKALSDIESGENTALEAITHRKEDAIATVGQAQTDATGAVQTAKHEAVDAVAHTGSTQVQAVTQAGEQAVQEVDAAAQAGVGSVEQTGGTQVQAVTAVGAEQVQAVESAAAEKLEGITQLAGQAADSATKAEQAAQRAEDAATAASALIDDTAITSAKTWSSKGIVDTLCPPIKATGNPVVCYPVENYPLGVTASWEPTQAGSGDPSPDNIRPISGRDAVKVERCGENLLDIELTNQMVGNTTAAEDGGWITINGTTSGGNLFLRIGFVLRPGRYTAKLFGRTSIDGDNALIWIYGGTIANMLTSKKITTTFSVNETTTVNVYLHLNKTVTFSSEQFAVALVPGSTPPTEYTPYRGDTLALALPSTIYGGELDAVTGKGQETWKLVTLTGEEGWSIVDTYIGIYNLLLPTDSGKAICTHFAVEDNFNGDCLIVTGGGSIYLGRALSNKYTVDTWCAYLAAQYAAGTPVQIAYKVATPTPITATGGKPIPALAGVNTVLTDGDSLTVTGRADIVHALAEMSRSVTQNAQVVDAMLGISPLAEDKNE